MIGLVSKDRLSEGLNADVIIVDTKRFVSAVDKSGITYEILGLTKAMV
jgi:hypothetical protein